MASNKELNIAYVKSKNVERQLFISKNNTNIHQQNDEELWHAFIEGSLTAFRLIYEQNSENLFNYGNKITPYHAIVSDSIQDMFIDLWNKRSKLGKVKNIRGYLFTCYRRRLLDGLKKQKKYLHIEHLNGSEILLSTPLDDWDLDADTQ